MNKKYLLDCYCTTRGVDFLEISFITFFNISHKVELKCIQNTNLNQLNDDDLKIQDPLQSININTQSQLLTSCNSSTNDSNYPFNKTLYFWHCKFLKLKNNQKYSFTILMSQHNDGNYIQIYSNIFSTLKRPNGKLLFRFGILADTHINMKSNISYGTRLYHCANGLCSTYIKHIAQNKKANFIIFPGDICDSGSISELNFAKQLLYNNKYSIKCYPIIGNHERPPKLFYDTFNLGNNGFYSFDYDKFHFIMICGPYQSSLDNNTLQYKWLIKELETNCNKLCFIFTHYSFILHECVSGNKNDGLQRFNNYKNLLKLFKKYKNSLKVIFAGHKNIPSVALKDNIYHLLSPQLIQSPCSYDIVDVYENGLVKNTFEINEQYLIYQSRVNGGELYWKDRFGKEQDRNVSITF